MRFATSTVHSEDGEVEVPPGDTVWCRLARLAGVKALSGLELLVKTFCSTYVNVVVYPRILIHSR